MTEDISRLCHNCSHYDGPYDSGEVLYGPWRYRHDQPIDWMTEAQRCREYAPIMAEQNDAKGAPTGTKDDPAGGS